MSNPNTPTPEIADPDDSQSQMEDSPRLDVPASSFDITAHIANVGDQWYWPKSAAGVPGSNAAIEAFTIALNGGPLGNDDLEYQCLHEDGTPGPWVRGGTLCGDKFRASRLLGFRMRLVGAASHSHVLEYRATFTNGANVDWTSAGSWCADIRRNYLESFEVRLRTASNPNTPTPEIASPDGPLSRIKNKLRSLDRLFLLTVLIPTLFAALYYGLIASDVYISESRFVIQSPNRQSGSGLNSLLQSTGITKSQDDTYSVHDYVLSRDALRELGQSIPIKEALASPHIDAFNRFGGVFNWNDSFEDFYLHYLKHVKVEYDTASSITTLYVHAFTAEEAQRINSSLLQLSERLVNKLNERARQDLIQVAEKEVRVAEERAKDATLALSGYRNRESLFDPDKQSVLQLQGVAKLQEELVASETQLNQLRRISPDNPQVATLRNYVESLRNAIAAESGKVAGGQRSLTSKSTAYDRLLLEKTFAERQLATALASLESARNEAQRKQLYLERLVQPNQPDRAMEPRRARSVLLVFLIGMILWGVLSLVVASVKEHTA